MLAELHQQLRHLPRGLRTRFAPSPTGHLHLGHAASAVFVWGIAQAVGAEVVIRMEDHDQGRVRKEYASSIIEDLIWLGLMTDPAQYFQQSAHAERYQHSADQLQSQGLVYACRCSRREIQERTGEPSKEELHYDGFCRKAGHKLENAGLRLIFQDHDYAFKDLWSGDEKQRPSEQCGDLLIRDREGNWTYNFAVAIDDAAEGIDLIIRGQDLLAATGRQLQLRELLGVHRALTFVHHPLILESSGQKLSKRYGSASLRSMRELGQRPEALLGQAAYSVGLLDQPRDVAAAQLGELFL